MYAILYTDGTLTISNDKRYLQKPIQNDYGQFQESHCPWQQYDQHKIKTVHILNGIKVSTLRNWFYDCINLQTLLHFDEINTSDCTNFSNMFYFCKNLQTLDGLQNWNVSNGVNFSYMFYGCEKLTELYLSETFPRLSYKSFMNCNKQLKINWRNKIYTIQDLEEYKTIY